MIPDSLFSVIANLTSNNYKIRLNNLYILQRAFCNTSIENVIDIEVADSNKYTSLIYNLDDEINYWCRLQEGDTYFKSNEEAEGYYCYSIYCYNGERYFINIAIIPEFTGKFRTIDGYYIQIPTNEELLADCYYNISFWNMQAGLYLIIWEYCVLCYNLNAVADYFVNKYGNSPVVQNTPQFKAKPEMYIEASKQLDTQPTDWEALTSHYLEFCEELAYAIG